MTTDIKKLAIIGGGPAGFMAAVNAAKNAESLQVDIYEKSSPLKTVLYTGNGRCNLGNNIYDFKELARNFPRGEKFLYSIFSRFGTEETVNWLASHGLETYVQEDNRIFPKTDKAATVRTLFLDIARRHGVNIIKKEIQGAVKTKSGFKIETDSREIEYDRLIISTGGDRTRTNNGYKFARSLGHDVTELRPALTAMLTKEKWTEPLAGVSIQNARVQSFFDNKKISDLRGGFVFTHKGLAGPAIFNTSSYCAYLGYSRKKPLLLKINFLPEMTFECLEKDLLSEFKGFPTKSISNILKKYIPKSLTFKLLQNKNIDPDKKVSVITAKERKAVLKLLLETEVEIVSPAKDGEIVTAGGIVLKQVNPKTMESKICKNLYFCGEVLDIDGLTGGFNLQMCWSTGYIAGINAAMS